MMPRVPRIEIEITRRSLPGERAEQFAIEFRATRSLFLPPYLTLPAMAWPWLGLGLAPLAAWQVMVTSMFAPGAAAAVPAIEGQAAVDVDRAPAGAVGTNVHPFPPRGGPPR